MNTVTQSDRLGKHCEALPGYAAWLQEQDYAYWLGVLRAAALKHYWSLHCACNGGGRCEHCRLDEALAHTAERPALAEEADVIDLEALRRASEEPLPPAA